MIIFKDELKHIHANVICCANKVTTKSTRVHGAIMLRGNGNKLEIPFNIN